MKTRLLTKIHNIAVKMLDFLFPPKKQKDDGALLKEARALNCRRLYSGNPYSYTHLNKYCLLPYSNKTIKGLIWKFKYGRDARATNFFADTMADELISLFSDTLSMNPLSIQTFIAYCPSSSYIFDKKAWDHMKDLALLIEKQCVSFHPHLNICIDALEIADSQNTTTVSKNIKEQHKGTRQERLVWAKNKYKLSPNFKKYLQLAEKKEKGIHIICIDDIFTTGATIKAALAAFEPIESALACKTTAMTLCFTEYGSTA